MIKCNLIKAHVILFDPYVPSDSRKKERVGSHGTPDEAALLHQVVGPSGGIHSQPGFTLFVLQLQVIRFMVINVPGQAEVLLPKEIRTVPCPG
ncbi:MAG: hypothetical protein CMN93_04820 [Synechococcus sp. CPC35]|nr:hypothetical protein [Synechococcus sp. CPC35]